MYQVWSKSIEGYWF